MSRYYVLEEDLDYEYKLYLGPIQLPAEERRAMILGDTRWIPREPMVIPIINKPGDELPDFLNTRMPLVSTGFKALLDREVSGRIFYRKAILVHENKFYVYYYILPRLIDCLDVHNSRFEQDPMLLGGLRFTGGFSLRQEQLVKVDIFRMKGLSFRQLLISQRLKDLLEEAGVRGVVMTATEQFCHGTGIFRRGTNKGEVAIDA
ncbi:MAG TPA: hypothetical protein GX391_00020 [Firmicutes bacterium]|jgi:hypothetical protein|nr:hypothetical protein [Bacillota bacterium]HOQ24939.1 hypothetical protein [Bacillota bacterium]HPT68130.1 hypothetical protein [Bacillota bacterium]